MRAIIALALGLALAVVGSLAVAGSSYTPPAASGGGVDGDGTGVTDASAFRTALGLGTAATLTAGTAAGNVVTLDGTGKLPAVDGSQLTGISATPSASSVPYAPASGGDWSNPDPTEVAGALDALAGRVVDVEAVTTDPEVSSLADLEWSSGTQIPAYLGSGTASLLPVGSGALNIVQLDADSKLPAVDGSALTGISSSPYAADSWGILNWTAGAGTMDDDGWTKGGGGGYTLTDESGTIGGVTARKLTPSAGTYAYYEQAVIPLTGSWECRIRMYMPVSDADGDPWYGFSIAGKAGGVQSGYYRRMGIAALGEGSVTSGIGYWGGTSLGAWAGAWAGEIKDKWVDWTFRFFDHAASKANSMYVWMGPVFIGNFPTTTSGGTGAPAPFITTSGTAQAIRIGKLNGATGAGVMYVHSVKLRSGWNEAPPEYTFRSYNGAVGP